MLQEMENKGIHVCGQSFTLAMAACLEGHRDSYTGTGLKGPPKADLQLSQAALSLFDRMVAEGETPTASSYALALKVPRVHMVKRLAAWAMPLLDKAVSCHSLAFTPRNHSECVDVFIATMEFDMQPAPQHFAP